MFSTFPWSLVGATLLGAISTYAQDRPGTSEWCDSITDICFQRYYDADLDIAWGYVFPPSPSAGEPQPDEFIGLFTGPVSAGWIGNSLGGGMRSNPLVVGWVDNEHNALLSVRFTSRFASPDPLEGPQLTLLGTSGANATHQRIVYRCQNCTVWEGGSNGIRFNETAQFGFAAHGSQKPDDVANADSSVPVHSVAGQHDFDVSSARSDSYDMALQQLQAAPPLRPPIEEDAPSPSTPAERPTGSNPSACANAPQASHAFKTGPGWVGTPVLGGLRTPRGIILDGRGNLLVIERGKGLTGHTLDSEGCVTNSKLIIDDTRLNHGIDVVGNRLVASSSDIAWAWDYNDSEMTVSNRRVLVTGMDNPGHVTRTLHISRKNPDYLVVSVGSDGNIDEASIQAESGTAQIRVFDMRTLPEDGAAYTDETYGKVLGYGLRNDVGITEDKAGNIHSIENSLDNAYRVVNGDQRDIHTDNPAEKVYNLGSPTEPAGIFGGYPICYTVWEEKDFRDGDTRKKPGDWFVQDPGNSTFNDEWCEANAVKPTVLLPPHTAPLDLKFGVKSGDSNLYASLHGSWNRQPPQGYKVVAVPGQFSSSGDWSPSGSLKDTKTSAVDILANLDENDCQRGCFRPVGLVFGNDGEHLRDDNLLRFI
ncbi:cellobiose dehydrogenase [Coprinopsis cinerea AmutBmut pab1-1]|nr:cellobiose dehydrogenase [Coprinopsis cinerea AmutBmut pab1-1]